MCAERQRLPIHSFQGNHGRYWSASILYYQDLVGDSEYPHQTRFAGRHFIEYPKLAHSAPADRGTTPRETHDRRWSCSLPLGLPEVLAPKVAAFITLPAKQRVNQFLLLISTAEQY